MAEAKRTSVPPDRLELYRRLLERVPALAEKSNFGSAYTAVNGNMVTMMSKHGVLGLRLPPDERAAFIERYETDLFRGDPAWPPAKEFVAVPAELLERTDELAPYLERSLAHVLTLKPKAGKRRVEEKR